MSYRITLIPGDGVGPEVTEASRRVLEATGIEFIWDIGIVGEKAQAQFGTPLPDTVIDSIKKNKLAFKGPVTTPIGSGFRSVNVALRKKLNLYACLRPCKTYTGVPTPFRNIDIVVVRENTEDLYAGIEFARGSTEANNLIHFIADSVGIKVTGDSGLSIKAISESGSRRIVQFAFNYARANGRKKVTAGHKANILKYSDGIFLDIAREVASSYADIEFEEMVIDALCMRLAKNPLSFDVIVLPNLYGDIVSDLCAGLIGGLGVAPGANFGDEIAIFEPTHGSAPKYSTKNMVNPMAMMLSGVMMLRYIGESDNASRLEAAISNVLSEGKAITYDLISNKSQYPAGTSQVADAVINKLINGEFRCQ